MDEVRYINLIHKYLAGEINSAGKNELDNWLNVSEENRRIFEDIRLVWNKVELEQPGSEPDMNILWQEIASKINDDDKKKIKNADLFSASSEISSENKIKQWWIAIAAVVLISIIVYQSGFNLTGQNAIQYVAQYGEQKEVKLDDGSTVKLNSGSKLIVSEDFNEMERNVELSGQAFFDIEHTGNPFRIKTGNTEIKVIGTSFDVWARNNVTKVIVKDGKVLFGNLKSMKDSAVILTKNQSSICINDNHPDLPKQVNSEKIIGWLDNKLIFDKTSIREVAKELERRFNIKINLGQVNTALTLTGTFDQKNLKSIIESICLTFDLSYKYDKGQYNIF